MSSEAIFSQGLDERLSVLGLTHEIVVEAVARSQAAWNSCTHFDPPSAPGTIGWSRAVRALREQLCPIGWMKSDRGNFSTVVNFETGVAIAVATGDANTGRRASPRTKYPKGPATANAVEENVLQFELFPSAEVEPSDVPRTGMNTWFLLIFRDQTETRFELSLPVEIGPDNRVSEWVERIVFDPLPSDSEPTKLDFGPEQEIVVEVLRKGTVDSK